MQRNINQASRYLSERMKCNPNNIFCFFVLGLNVLPPVMGFICSSGFQNHLSHPFIYVPKPSKQTTLAAKKNKAKNKKSKPKGGGGGGFGPTIVTQKPTIKADDDFGIFPALEPDVQNTLVSSSFAKEAEDLSTEMYERLAGIYGFESFNYLSAPSSLEQPSSIEDLISAKPASSSQDFNDLMAPKKKSDDDILSLLDTTLGETSETKGASATTDKDKSDREPIPSLESSISKLAPFEKFRVLHVDPLVLEVEEFLTAEECLRYQALSSSPESYKTQSQTVGKDSVAQSSRTSTTWFHCYERVPEFMAKTCRLLGLDSIEKFEEPQTVRYRTGEKFTWHLDALSPTGISDGDSVAGQRVATILVYLTSLPSGQGGATLFRDLPDPRTGKPPLRVQPKQGNALLFFPAAGGIPSTPLDIRTLHCGEVVGDSENDDDKWIAQCWIRKGRYTVTAPPGNSHHDASSTIQEYCQSLGDK